MNPMLKKMAEAFQADLREQRVLYEMGRQPDPQRLMMFTGECADLPRALRAALRAIREPDDAMAEAGWLAAGGPPAEFTAMIDAILADKPEGGA